MPDSTITLRTRADTTGFSNLASAARRSIADFERLDRQFNALRDSEIRAARASGDYARALGLVSSQLSSAAPDSIRYNNLLAQQAQLSRQAAAEAARLSKAGGIQILPRSVESFGTQALDQIKSGLLGVVGPAALVTAGFAAMSKAIDLTEEGFRLKARLDETTRSIQIQLRGVRDSGEIFRQASAFAAQYGLTQEETNQSIKASVGILRNSTASATDLLGVLARLQVASPEQSLEGAALAVKELQSGDIQSLVERFEISRTAANKMKEEIKGGADAVTVLSKYLTDSGIGMETLATRTEGAAGKMRLLAQEQEKFSLALGGAAGGPGLALLEARIAVTANATRVLSGDTKTLVGDLGGLAVALNPVASALTLVGAADDVVIGKINELAGTSIPSIFDPLKLMTDEWARFLGIVEQTPAGVPHGDDWRNDLQAIARDANAAAAAIAGVTGANPNKLPHLTDRGPTLGGAVGGLGARLTKASNTAAEGQRKANDEAERLADLQFQNRLIKAKDNAAKIAILERQKAKETDVIKRQQIQNQIDQERQGKSRAAGGAAGGRGLGALDKIDIDLAGDYTAQLEAVNRRLAAGHLTELQTKQLKKEQLDLQKKIADETDRAANASLDARIAAIEDRKAKREEANKLSGAQRRLNSAEFYQEEKAAAQDVVELIPLQQEKRARDIAAKARGAGIEIPGASQSNPFTLAPGAATAPGGAPPAPEAANVSGQPLILQLDGKEVGRILLPTIAAGLRAGVAQVSARGG